jgi:hypothetical protein
VSVRRRLQHLLFGTSIAATLLLASASAAFAQDEPPNLIENLRLGTATIDLQTRLPIVTVTMDCVADASFVRIRLTLTQKAGTTSASSLQTVEGTCVAGTTISRDITFGLQQGTFRPGKASISGFAAANNGLPPDDLETIPPTDLFLRHR